MFFYYRISDKSYQKEKLPGIGKKECLENFLSVFKNLHGIILADNCNEETMQMLLEIKKSNKKISICESNLGNAQALKWCIQNAISENEKYDHFYFVEDDYLHLPKAAQTYKEALNIASYATFYDHPDKYTQLYDFGETSKVYRGSSHHWRLTQSTTMTFMARRKDLERDYEIWKKHTSDQHPNDHRIFTEIVIANEKTNSGKLICAIPGLSTHTDLSVSIATSKVLLEPWALEMACRSLEKKIATIDADSLQAVIATTPNDNWDRVKLLHVLSQTYCCQQQ